MESNKKVTIQDIADALNLSRNTVSKAINNSGGLADSTRDAILQKAAEMGYKQFSYVTDMMASAAAAQEYTAGVPVEPMEIALFTSSPVISNSHFASLMLDKFTKEIQPLGYRLATYRVSPQNIESLTLPRTFLKENVHAVMCIEIFDHQYSELICSIGLPTLFVDCAPIYNNNKSINADLLLMDNINEITKFISEMVSSGIKKIGFIGDYTHCQSFYERYLAYRISMMKADLPVKDKYILCPKDGDLDVLANMLESLDSCPELFICANDFVAMDAIMILRNLGKKIPQDVRFFGFDDSQESRYFIPSLSTVHIHTQAMAFSAVQLLISRIKEPTLENRIVHVATDLILRESTKV